LSGDVRRLTLDDLPACLDLAADREWPREEHKWRLLFAVGEVLGIVEPGEASSGRRSSPATTRAPRSAWCSWPLAASGAGTRRG
jgi:hypothetical protein